MNIKKFGLIAVLTILNINTILGAAGTAETGVDASSSGAFRPVRFEISETEPNYATGDGPLCQALVKKYEDSFDKSSPLPWFYPVSEPYPRHYNFKLEGRFESHVVRQGQGCPFGVLISEDGKALLMLDDQKNMVFPPNRYTREILKAYAELGMGTLSSVGDTGQVGPGYVADDGEYTPGDFGFLRAHMVIDPEATVEDRTRYFREATSLMEELMASGAKLPRGGKTPKAITFHLHPEDPDVRLLTSLGYRVLEVEGAKSENWLWDLAEDSSEEAKKKYARLMLVKTVF